MKNCHPEWEGFKYRASTLMMLPFRSAKRLPNANPLVVAVGGKIGTELHEDGALR